MDMESLRSMRSNRSGGSLCSNRSAPINSTYRPLQNYTRTSAGLGTNFVLDPMSNAALLPYIQNGNPLEGFRYGGLGVGGIPNWPQSPFVPPPGPYGYFPLGQPLMPILPQPMPSGGKHRHSHKRHKRLLAQPMPLMGGPIEEVTSENESNVNSVFNDAATALTNDTGFSMITDHEPSAPLGTFLQQQSTFSTLPDPLTLNFNSQAAGFMPQSGGEAFSPNPNPSISIPVSAQSQLQPPLLSPLHCQTSAPAERTGAPVVTFSNGKPQVMLYDPNPHTPTPVASHEPSPCSNCVESSSASGSASGQKGRRSRCCTCGLLCSLFLATIALVNLVSPLAMLAFARLHAVFVPRPPVDSLSNETSSSPSSSFTSSFASSASAPRSPALAECGSELLALGLKLVLLASLACALYARRSRASLPRTPPMHALVVLLFTLLPLPFWLLWLLGLPQPHNARDPFLGTSISSYVACCDVSASFVSRKMRVCDGYWSHVVNVARSQWALSTETRSVLNRNFHRPTCEL